MINPWVETPALTSSRLVMGEANPEVEEALAHIVIVKLSGLRSWSKGTSIREPPSNVSEPPVAALAPSAGASEPTIVPSKPFPLASVPSASSGHQATSGLATGTEAITVIEVTGTSGSSEDISRVAVKVPSWPRESKVTSRVSLPPPAAMIAGRLLLK